MLSGFISQKHHINATGILFMSPNICDGCDAYLATCIILFTFMVHC